MITNFQTNWLVSIDIIKKVVLVQAVIRPYNAVYLQPGAHLPAGSKGAKARLALLKTSNI